VIFKEHKDTKELRHNTSQGVKWCTTTLKMKHTGKKNRQHWKWTDTGTTHQ